MKLGNYSKLIAGILGNVVAIAIAYAATSFPAVAECVPAPAAVAEAAEEICTLMGFTQTQITVALMVIVNAIFIERAPANKPPA